MLNDLNYPAASSSGSKTLVFRKTTTYFWGCRSGKTRYFFWSKCLLHDSVLSMSKDFKDSEVIELVC